MNCSVAYIGEAFKIRRFTGKSFIKFVEVFHRQTFALYGKAC